MTASGVAIFALTTAIVAAVAGCKKPPGPRRSGLVCGEPDRTFVAVAKGQRKADSSVSEILKYAVTSNNYECCVAAGACPPDTVLMGPGAGCTVGVDRLAQHPVNCVSHAGAESYCKWIGGSLPNAAFWVAAARAEDPTAAWPWGSEWRTNAANCDPGVCKDRYPVTAPVRAFASFASAAGAVQMAGNVFEWTSTWFSQPRRRRSDADLGPGLRAPARTFRVLKGGSWREHEHAMRIESEHYKRPEERLSNIGFRCAR